MLHLLFITLFVSNLSIINAAHTDGHIYNIEEQMKTESGKLMYNMRKGNSIMWYYDYNNGQPACRFNTQNLNLDYLDVKKITGNDFDDKICIKPSSKFWYFKIIDSYEKKCFKL